MQLFNVVSLMERAKAEKLNLIHSLKVATALSVTTLFVLFTRNKEFIGEEGTWAIMTVVFVCEFTAGTSNSKAFNRFAGTLMGAVVLLGAATILRSINSTWQQYLLICFFIFWIGCISTYIRFIPKVKARYEYGTIIFLLTFSFLLIPATYAQSPLKLVLSRLFMVAVGNCISIGISNFLYPIWAGEALHRQIERSFDILANCLEDSVGYYCSNNEMKSSTVKSLNEIYASLVAILSSQSIEKSLEVFASWEPPHGKYRMLKYPWDEYIKVAGTLRHCGCSLFAFHMCLLHCKSHQLPNSGIQAKIELVIQTAAQILHELDKSFKYMQRSNSISHLLNIMQDAVKDLDIMLQRNLERFLVYKSDGKEQYGDEEKKLNSNNTMNFIVLAVALTETTVRVQQIAHAFGQLEKAANFKTAADSQDMKNIL